MTTKIERIKEALAILNALDDAEGAPAADVTGRFVLVRTVNAGVHVGAEVGRGPGTITLRDARRVWRWKGANTLHELSLHGADMKEHTRISEPVPLINIEGVIEVIPCSDEARVNLSTSRWLP